MSVVRDGRACCVYVLVVRVVRVGCSLRVGCSYWWLMLVVCVSRICRSVPAYPTNVT